jgi:hypothetical protein
MKIEWKRKVGRFENGVNCYIGKIKVGSVNLDLCPTDKSLRYNVSCSLPQVKKGQNYATEYEGKEALLKMVIIWFDSALGIGFINGETQ